MSNYICEDAETSEFHQEYGSMYTFISMPQWDTNEFVSKKSNKNETNPDTENMSSIKPKLKKLNQERLISFFVGYQKIQKKDYIDTYQSI